MQRWEYKVISLRKGSYTATLNEYGREGWELVSVVSDDHDVSPSEQGRSIPMPRALGRLEDAAAKLNKLGAAGSAGSPSDATSTLLWVFRRPLDGD
jgi:uncharacterized protein DUF4177